MNNRKLILPAIFRLMGCNLPLKCHCGRYITVHKIMKVVDNQYLFLEVSYNDDKKHAKHGAVFNTRTNEVLFPGTTDAKISSLEKLLNNIP